MGTQFRSMLTGALDKINAQQLLRLAHIPSLLSTPSSCAQSCPNAQLSCHNTTDVSNLCCFNYPGGQLLQTQFWDTSPAIGPGDSWTIHGLWPDHCDGTFDEFCDQSRQYRNITDILSTFGNTALLDYMQTYWAPDRGSAEAFYEHEWGKHGTCISTLDTACYDPSTYTPQQEIYDYFLTTVTLFKTLDTYQTLASASILPTTSKTYTLGEILDPLITAHSAPPTLRCTGSRLNEIWYHFDVLGSVQTGRFVPSTPDGAKSNCPAAGIHYLPKSSPSTSTTASSSATHTTISPTHSTPPPPPNQPFHGKGTLQIFPSHNPIPTGCLISAGYWYISGTCATFHVADDAQHLLVVKPSFPFSPTEPRLFTLTSSKGPCSIYQGAFQCAKTMPEQTVFGHNGTALTYRGSSRFVAVKVPGRYEKAPVSPYTNQIGDGDWDEEVVELEIHWA